MTVIAALHQNDEIWMAADQEISHHDFARRDLVNSSKIIPFQHALIGAAGLALFKTH